MFLKVMELVVTGLFLVIVYTQIFIPLWRGTPIFPLFRTVSDLQEQLAKAKEKTIEKDLQEKIKKEAKK
mgnify:CR=1 FL=1